MTPRLTPAGCVACLLAAAGFSSAADTARLCSLTLFPWSRRHYNKFEFGMLSTGHDKAAFMRATWEIAKL